MAISDELTRIQTAKADIKASIEAKGVTVPSSALIDQYADYIDEIQTGGGGGGQAEEDLKNLIERDIASITIPNGTTTIGVYAFYRCSSLTSITIPDSVTSIGERAFNGCTSLTSVTIPDSVTTIATSAFNSCSDLTSINIPSGVTKIEGSTFYQCTSLTSITIPSGVTSIGSLAFSRCRGLTSITCLATTPPTLSNVNAFQDTTCPIYVPSESVEAYKTTGNWVTYADRIQAIPSE